MAQVGYKWKGTVASVLIEQKNCPVFHPRTSVNVVPCIVVLPNDT